MDKDLDNGQEDMPVPLTFNKMPPSQKQEASKGLLFRNSSEVKKTILKRSSQMVGKSSRKSNVPIVDVQLLE